MDKAADILKEDLKRNASFTKEDLIKDVIKRIKKEGYAEYRWEAEFETDLEKGKLNTTDGLAAILFAKAEGFKYSTYTMYNTYHLKVYLVGFAGDRDED